MKSAFRLFFTTETLGGLTLMTATVAALIAANSIFAPTYAFLQTYPFAGHGLQHWVNDALMAVFFLLVGMEIKREMLVGNLSTWPQRLLPGLCALGGMAVPALIYAARNYGSPETMVGWAIPTATDIAFALGILALFGKRVPVSLKVFLTALAILDDLGAILVIALFYTPSIQTEYLLLAGLLTTCLVMFNRHSVRSLWPYLLTGTLLWYCVYLSGLHATLAGVVLALTIPLQTKEGHNPLLTLEHALQPYVAFLILPVFGFFNAGVALSGLSLSSLSHPVTAGVFWGLFLGKQIGIGLAYYIAVKWLGARKPEGARTGQVYAIAVLCGMGFTMSLFIGNLSFSDVLLEETRLGILLGSLASALLACVLLLLTKPSTKRSPPKPTYW